ncbi:uncharacterized protein LOC144425245 isoform X2 [Styela clava]
MNTEINVVLFLVLFVSYFVPGEMWSARSKHGAPTSTRRSAYPPPRDMLEVMVLNNLNDKDMGKNMDFLVQLQNEVEGLMKGHENDYDVMENYEETKQRIRSPIH